MRAGFEVYFRKRLFELVEGRLHFTVLRMLKLMMSAPVHHLSFRQWIVYFQSWITLSRDTRDSILFPE